MINDPEFLRQVLKRFEDIRKYNFAKEESIPTDLDNAIKEIQKGKTVRFYVKQID